MTGGLQEQVTDGKNFFGFGIKPCSKTVIGSLQVPYIYEDRISQSDFEKTLTKAINLPSKKYRQMVSGGRRHISKSDNFETFEKSWVELMDKIMEEKGSWENRKQYKNWHLMEVA
jgi:hypothetical protein